MKSYGLVAFVVLVIIVSGCSMCVSRLEEALALSGENREELEKVLEYYSSDPADSLKYKAAVFLIENMPGHYSYADYELADNLYRQVDSVYRLDILPGNKMNLVDSIVRGYPDIRQNIVEDCRIIRSDFLIKNIDDAFSMWRTHYFNNGVSFEMFCEYILPYKTVECQRLDSWRDSMRTYFHTRFAENIPYNGEYRRFSYYGAAVINNEMRRKFTPRPLAQEYLHPLLMDASTMCRMPYGLCEDFSVIGVSLMRSCGIPAALDYIPMWSDQNNGHTFFSVFNGGMKTLPMIWGYESNPGDAFPPDQICAKVFRHTYAKEERMSRYFSEAKYRHDGFNSFMKDVTSEYMSVSDINIPVYAFNGLDKYVYIATFNCSSWYIQDFGVLKKGNAVFENIGREIAYIVLGYDGVMLKPISNPFFLHWDGSIEYLEPDYSRMQTVTLSRKFPQKDHTEELEHRIIGGRIQASNDKDFKKHRTFHVVDTLAGSLVKEIQNDRPYRYWRFSSSDKGWCNLAELQFFEKGDTSSVPVKGKIIGTLETYGNNDWWSPEHAFDGDWLTCFHYKEEKGGWIGLDMGRPVCVDRVLYVPRSDDNGIHLEDVYELLYWNKGKWVSAGRKIGKEWNLVYENIPYNALLWLKNHTRGQEERIFVYENGEQLWW